MVKLHLKTGLGFFLFFMCSLKSVAQTTSWKGTTSTSWSTATNWTNGVPTSVLDAVIGDANFTGINQPTISSTATCKSLTIGGTVASILTVKRSTTVLGNLQLNSNGSIVHNSYSVSVKGNWINDGSYSATGSGCNVIFAGTAQSLQGSVVTTFRKLTINAGSVTTLNNNVTVSGSSSICTVKGTLNANESPTYKITGTALTVNNNAILKVKGALFTDNYSMSGTVTLSAGSIVEYAATALNQTISSSYTYSTLTISGAGTKSLGANLPSLRSTSAAYGNIYVNSGILDLGTYTANRGTSATGGILAVANNATLKIGGTNSFPSNFSTITLSLASTVEYNGASQTVAAQTYGNLKVSSSAGSATKTFPATAFTISGDLTSTIGSGSAVSFTAASNITVSGAVNIGASTTFNGGSYTIAVAGNFTNNGTFTGGTSTVNINSGGSVISGAGANNFYNLIVSASNITASGSTGINVAGDFSTSGPGVFTHLTGGTFTMSGSGKTISGTGITFDNLSISGTISTGSSLVIAGNLAVSGSYAATAGTTTMNGASKTISGAGTISFGALQISGSVTSGISFSIAVSLDISGTFSATAGTVTFSNTSVLNGTASLYNVTINGTSLTLSSNAVLGIANTFTITAGTLNVTSNLPNTVVFNGTGAQTVNAITYNHLSLLNGNTKTAGGNITINGNLTIGTSTTLAGSSYTHTLLGNWVNNGSFTAGTSTVQLTGSSNTSISGSTTFNTLTVNKSSSSNVVTLQNNVSVPVINMTTGILNTGSNTITITSTRNGNGIILGTITRTHTFITATSYAFESPNNTINFSAVSGVTSVTVQVSTGIVSDYPNGDAINRVYTITVPAGSYTATLRLHYEDGELNGSDESTMQLARYNGSNWTNSGKTANSTSSNYVEQSGLTGITNRWTCSNSSGVVKWTGAVSSDWTNAGNWSIVSGAASTPPSSNDIVQIGVSAFTNQPVINTAVTVKNIVFGSSQAATLTLASGGSLTTNGNISGSWSAGATHTIDAGNQNITINGDLLLSDGVSGHAINLLAGAATITVNGSISQSGGAGISFSGAATLNIKNDFIYSSGAFNAGSGTVNFSGTNNQLVAPVTYNHLTIIKTAGTAQANSPITVNGNLLVSTGSIVFNANAAISGNVTINTGTAMYGDGVTISTAGDWTNNGTFVAGTGTVTFNGAGAQALNTTAFNNLVINKTAGTLALSGNVTVSSDLFLQAGTMNLGTYSCDRSTSGGTMSLSNGAVLLVTGANNFPRNYTTYTLGSTSLVHYNGVTAQSVAGVAYGNLSFSNGGAKTLSATATVNGDITINSGATFDGSAYSINLWGNWINNGTYTPSTSTLILRGSGKTITGNTTFNRVTVYGSYTVNGSDVTYNGLMNITSTGSYTAGSGTATVNGDLINSGILTSTGTTTFTGTTLQTIRLLNAIASTSTGIINFNGSVSPVLNSTSTPTYANLNINNTGGINPSVDWQILVSMTIASGAAFNGGQWNHTINGNFTNNGTVTSSGTISFAPSAAATIKLSGTSFTSTGTVVFGGSGQVTVTGTAGTLNDVRITNTNSAGIAPPSGWTIGNDFIIGNNAIFNAGSYSHSVAGDIECNGTLNGSSSTFTMSGAAAQLTGDPYTIFNHFTVTGNVTVNSDFYVAGNFTNNGIYDGSGGTLIMNGSNAAAIGGTTAPISLPQLTIEKSSNAVVTMNVGLIDVLSLYITSGTLYTSTNSITQDAGGGLLLISGGATLKLGGTNSLPGFSAYGLDVTSTVDYAGANQVIGNAASYGNLTISTTGTKTGVVPLIIQNNFTLTAGTFSSGVSVTHTVGGNWLMTGGSYVNSSSTIVFNGSGTQDISSTGAFNNVTINKASGQMTLSSAVTINGTLNLTAGKIVTGNNSLALGGAITNAGTTSYIVVDGTGTVNQLIAASGTKSFPVGSATYYTPATIAFTGGSTPDSIRVGMLPAVYYNGNTGATVNTNVVNTTWLIAEAIAGGSNATVTLQWPAAMELSGFNRSSCRLAHYTSGAWEYGPADLSATGSDPYIVSRSGFTVFSPFVVGNINLVVPLTWLSINGYNDHNDNIVNWTVASELNNHHFEVESSNDAIHFSVVGKLPGTNPGSGEANYTFTHHGITGPLYYYRIRQVDIDGRFTYSKILTISTGRREDQMVLLNNGGFGEIGVSIYNKQAGNATIMMVDAAGHQLYRQKLKLNTGNNIVSMPDPFTAAGLYYLILIRDNGSKTVAKYIKR